MVFNATFNNISVISWWSVLLAEETRIPGENHRPVESDWQALSHNACCTPGFELSTPVVIGTDCIGSCKSNYHMITATTAPEQILSGGDIWFFFLSLSFIDIIWIGEKKEILKYINCLS
jgi:hypothetical protein